MAERRGQRFYRPPSLSPSSSAYPGGGNLALIMQAALNIEDVVLCQIPGDIELRLQY